MLYFWSDDFGQVFGCFQKGTCGTCGVTVVVEPGVIEDGLRGLDQYDEKQRIFPPMANGTQPDCCVNCAPTKGD